MLHLRLALESTFRKTLKDLEGTYRRKVRTTIPAGYHQDCLDFVLLVEDRTMKDA